MRNSKKILLARLLSNSGDHAWNFALPVTFAILNPGKISVLAFILLSTHLSNLFLLPLSGSLIDRLGKQSILKLALSQQTIGVALQFYGLIHYGSSIKLGLLLMIVGGIFCGVGSNMNQILVSQSIIPELFKNETLTKFNSKVKQVDLFTEIGAPILAGLLLLVQSANISVMGVALVALWNLISFFPEFLLSRSVIRTLNSAKSIRKTPTAWKSFAVYKKGWKEFIKSPISPSMIAYAFLWVSVLSPHGVLLTSFLKESWNLNELSLSAFRGLGAVFGFSATILFPLLVKRFQLTTACRVGLASQAFFLILGFYFFTTQSSWLFLGCLLLSRIGLYAFSLGEEQIRQLSIAEDIKGSVNSVAASLTNLASIILFAIASVLDSSSQFVWLVGISVTSVVLANLIFYKTPKVQKQSAS